MSVGFVLLADGTFFKVFLYILGKAGPPVSSLQLQVTMYKITRMS